VEQRRSLALKVGIFVAAAAIVAFVVVVILGKERLWFTDKITLHAAFPDVAGLQEGATVRLAGRAVGIVTDIGFSDDPDPGRAVVVSFRLPAHHARRIHADSTARIDSLGLLGDKLLEVSLGSPASPPIRDGSMLAGERPQDLDETLREVRGVVAEARGMVAAGRRVVEQVERGPGSLHALLYEDDLHDAALGVVKRADRLVGAVRPDEVQRVVGNVARASDAVVATAESVDREALRRASQDIAAITADVRKGKGTLGGLLMDPTLYEETKRVIADVRRNRVLKALTRYLISREEPAREMDGSPVDVKVVPRSLGRGSGRSHR
jgi:phospholipid/cholesterol/gamma-HCH transport system substrate-binding protein